MILDVLENAGKYTGFRMGLSEAFGFLDQAGLSELSDGKYEILGDRVFAIVAHENGRSVSDGKLEGHRKYIDIQYVIRGEESIGWRSRSSLPLSNNYDEEKDLEFFEGAPESIVRVPPGSFAVFLPHDAHLPLLGEGVIHKVVVKISVD